MRTPKDKTTIALRKTQLDRLNILLGLTKKTTYEFIEDILNAFEIGFAHQFKRNPRSVLNGAKHTFSINVTVAPMPTVHSIPCPMTIPNSEVDKIISEDMKKKRLLEK